MTVDEERHYMQYFYNSVIEFMYFVILYIESFGKTNLNTVCKHVKFFKIEVAAFILSFDGKTFEDKLCQMLNTLDCFTLFDDKICINENKSIKSTIFEDLVISKCVDLVLRGINNIDAVCENLNFNNVISINKNNILDVLEKSSYFSIKNKQTVILHHIHGLLGFEDGLSNSIVCYFYNILYRNKILSFNEVRDHSKCLSFCGIHNLIMIFSILNSSKQFYCENGFIWLKKKSKKSPKLQSLHMEQHHGKYSSRSLPIGQIVYSAYGSSLYKWSGEIGSLNESSGIIYCVVDFTNSYQGVFSIYFNETSLKVISETGNLKKYLNIRDAVEFDAKYYSGRNFERCWIATRLKLLHNNKFEYDEHLYDKLCCESELLKNQCADKKCCLSSTNISCGNLVYDNTEKAKSSEYEDEEKLLPKMKTSGYESYSMCNSVDKLKLISENDSKDSIPNQKPSDDLHLSFSNLITVDYSFMFGFVYMLMADKGIAIAKQGGNYYNILFMKNSVYAPDKFKNLVNGQKVLVLIPYHGTLESFCVSTLVYGLSDQETFETEKSNVLPRGFAVQVFVDKIAEKLKCQFCNNYNVFNGCMSKEKNFTIDLEQRKQLIELYKFILREYKVRFQSDYLLQFLFGLYRINFSDKNFNKKAFHFIVKLSKYLNKHVIQKRRTNSERKMKRMEDLENKQIAVQVEDLCASVSELSLTDKDSVSNSNLALKSKSLDVLQASMGTLNSFETCSSSDSNESFYSCESNCYSPRSSCSSLLSKKGRAKIPDSDLPDETQIDSKLGQVKQLQTKSNRKVSLLFLDSNQEFTMKPQGKNLKQRLQYINQSKYLCLKSVPFLKHSVKKKRRIILPSVLKSVCGNCFKSSVRLAGYISMISKSFFFYTLNINGCDVTLPLPKQVIPPDLHRNMKLNSYSEITVIPNVLENLSHVIAANIFM